ncbi:hypothetical protein G7054_g2931 [Neopestalotiopsis clavispora]|nr:hypothetical protein G7054_g2931 [Neopestalotiopsis clavispora]
MERNDQPAQSKSSLEEAWGDQRGPMRPISLHGDPSITVDRDGESPKPLPRRSLDPKSTRNGTWPQSPFYHQREDTLNRMKWSVDAGGNPGKQNYVRAYEFRWSDIPGQQRCDMCEFSQPGGNVNDGTFDANIQQWIAETRNQGVTIRLFIGYMVRTGKYPVHCLSLTRGAFEAIEKDFVLHPATARTFVTEHDALGLHFAWSGQKGSASSAGDSVWFVSHFDPIISENWMMSLRYDQQRQRTDAIVFTTHDGEWLLNRVVNELLILHKSWKQFRVLPEAFRQCYQKAWWSRTSRIEKNMMLIERELGATRNWEADGTLVDDWPQNIDVRQTTVKLHENLYDMAINKGGLQKVKQMKRILDKAESWSENTEAATIMSSAGARELDQYSAWTDALLEQTDAKMVRAHERAQIQADLLFSIISQKDSREGISTAQSAFVFTFITALFLPCTVVASIFSMSMFDWQPETDSGSYISDKFWIYWTISIPLTIVVMVGWYWWSLKGMKLWDRSSSEDNKDAKGWRARSRWVRFLGTQPKTKNV